MLSRLSHALSEIAAHRDDPWWFRSQFAAHAVGPLQAALRGRDGIDVVDAEWDTLVVLDACRADAFERVVDVDRFDEFRAVESAASATVEWVERHFAGRSLGDVVYVTANPQVSRVAPDAFFDLRPVWEDHTDERKRVTPPAAVTEAALDAARPDKRLVVHYMQPHAPYLGDGWPLADRLHELTDEGVVRNMWDAATGGVVSMSELRAAYRACLDHVVDHAMELVETLSDRIGGRTVITSDHGELFGERLWPVPIRGFGHPRNLRSPELTRVPWAVVDGERRWTVAGETTEHDVGDDVADRLADLGYR